MPVPSPPRSRSVTSLVVLVTLGCLLAAAVTGLPPHDRAVAAAPRPDIVVVLVDDARLSDLGAVPAVRRRIGRHGATLTNFYSSFPLCCPARATLLTGQYPHNHGVLSNRAPTGGFSAFDDGSTLATWLQDDYRTALIGKYFNQYRPPYRPPGWDAWMVPGSVYDYRNPEWWTVRGHRESRRDLPGHQTRTIGDLASAFIADHADDREPYFLYTSFVAPHAGLPADPDDPKGFPTPFVGRGYRDAQAGARLRDPAFDEADVSDKPVQPAPLSDEEVAGLTETNAQRREALLRVQDAVRQMLDALEAAGSLDETYLLFLSDNGYVLGEHRIRGGKVAPYEPSNHVPFLVAGPGIAPRTTVDAVTAQVDVAPTVMAMAREPVPRSVDGVDLLPLLTDPDAAPPTRRAVLLEATDTKARTDPLPWLYRGVVTRRWKYVERDGVGRELYHRTTDPSELENLADRPAWADRQQRMAVLLERYRDCSGAGCR